MGALEFIIFFGDVDEVGDGFGEGEALPVVAILGEIGFEGLHFEGVPPAAALLLDFIEIVVFEVDGVELLACEIIIGRVIMIEDPSIFLFLEEGVVGILFDGGEFWVREGILLEGEGESRLGDCCDIVNKFITNTID